MGNLFGGGGQSVGYLPPQQPQIASQWLPTINALGNLFPSMLANYSPFMNMPPGTTMGLPQMNYNPLANLGNMGMNFPFWTTNAAAPQIGQYMPYLGTPGFLSWVPSPEEKQAKPTPEKTGGAA